MFRLDIKYNMGSHNFNFNKSLLLIDKLRTYYPDMGSTESDVEKAIIKVLRNFPKDFGKNLKKIRRERGLLQSTLCSSLGIGKNTYSWWELGEHAPRLRNLQQLSDFFGVDVGELFVEMASEHKQCKVSFIPVYISDSFFATSYEDIVTNRKRIEHAHLIKDPYNGKFEFAFKVGSNDMYGSDKGININSYALCTTEGFSEDKIQNLFVCSGKVVLLSIARGPAMLREIHFNGTELRVVAWNPNETDYVFPLTDDDIDKLSDKEKFKYHNVPTNCYSVEVFGIVKKVIFDL